MPAPALLGQAFCFSAPAVFDRAVMDVMFISH
jgi:hypothetical protein